MKSNDLINLTIFDRISARPLFWPIFIVVAIYVFNIPYMFFDGFWHDDGYWFYQAVEGDVNTGPMGDASVFAPYLAYFYSYGMVYLGTDLLHFVYIGAMALISLSFYYFYSRVLQFNKIIAIPSAIIPNILPSLTIPLGFNASYAMWALLPFLLSLIFLYKANGTHSKKWYISYALAFALYFISLNISAVGTFLIPCALLFFLFFLERKNLLIIFAKSLPFLFYGLFHLYNHSQNTHKTPVLNSIDIVLDRLKQFFEMSGFLMLSEKSAVWIILVLSIIGFVGVNTRRYTSLNIFNGQTAGTHRLFVTLWILCWLGANSVAYLVVSPTFRPNDYAYIFNFGAVILQISGIVFIFYFINSAFSKEIMRKKLTGFFITALILLVGVQRVYGYYTSPEIKQIENTSFEIRSLLSDIELPSMSQVVIFGVETPHSGVIDVNTGYVRYLIGNDDVNALLGFDRYPTNPFKKKGSWLGVMNGLKTKYPIVMFRRVKDGFQQVDYLLKTTRNKASKYPRLSWRLYDISEKNSIPKMVSEGAGMESYHTFVNDYFDEESPYIAFSPKTSSYRILDHKQAADIEGNGNMLSKNASYESGLLISNIRNIKVDDKAYAQFLVYINDLPDRKYKLGYKVKGEERVNFLDSSEYVIKGDYLLLYHPIANMEAKVPYDFIELYNVGVRPYEQLSN